MPARRVRTGKFAGNVGIKWACKKQVGDWMLERADSSLQAIRKAQMELLNLRRTVAKLGKLSATSNGLRGLLKRYPHRQHTAGAWAHTNYLWLY